MTRAHTAREFLRSEVEVKHASDFPGGHTFVWWRFHIPKSNVSKSEGEVFF